MQFIKEIIKKHIGEDGVLDLESATKEINEKFPENAVPKEQYNNISKQLEESASTITALEAQTKDNPEAQAEIEKLTVSNESLKAEYDSFKKKTALDKALGGKVKDPEYATFIYNKDNSEINLDEAGNVKDFDAWFMRFGESYKDHVVTDEDTPAVFKGVIVPQPASKEDPSVSEALFFAQQKNKDQADPLSGDDWAN